MRRAATLLLTNLLALAALPPAIADNEPPMPRVFKGVPTQKGSWRVEMLEMHRPGKDAPVGLNLRGMSICMDNALQLANQGRQLVEQRGCKTRVLKDTPTVAQIEAKCEHASYRSTITREGRNRYLIEGEGAGSSGEPFSVRARYSYEGACKEGAGTVSLDKNSAQCKRMREQMANLSPDKSCGKLVDEQRKRCEAQIQQSLAQINSMCPE
jgi:hypothetical protein